MQNTSPTDRETPPSETHSDATPTELAPRRVPSNAKPGSSKGTRRDRSPAALEDSRKENLMLPSSTYKNNRHSAISQKSDISGNGEDFFIPMALDPNPAPGPSPLTNRPKVDKDHRDPLKPQAVETKTGSRDYFSHTKPATSSSRKHSHDKHGTQVDIDGAIPSSRKHSYDKHGVVADIDGEHASSPPTSPHIAYQEKGRQPSSELIDTIRKRKDHGAASGSSPVVPSPVAGNDKTRIQHAYSPKVAQTGQDNFSQDEKFKLQEVPKSKKSGGSARSSKSEGPSPLLESPGIMGGLRSVSSSAVVQTKEQHVPATVRDSPKPLLSELTVNGAARTALDPKSRENGSMDFGRSLPSAMTTQLPKRGDSLGKSQTTQAVPRKEIRPEGFTKATTKSSSHDGERETSSSASSLTTTLESPTALARINGGRTISKPVESPTTIRNEEKPAPPARAQGRLALGSATNDSFTTPRAPPQPPADYHKTRNASISTLQSEPSHNGDHPSSPALPRYSAGVEFSMDDDMARILGTDESRDHASFLRRVSNSVRHGRSYSDKGGRMSKDNKWPSSPLNGTGSTGFGPEISSPSTSSPESREELTWFKNELRRERQKTVEKDQKIAELEAAVEGKASIKQVNTELREKRSTMVVLDTQKEIVVRELEVLTDHIAAAKKSGEPMDLAKLSSNVLREFAEALQKLKDSFAPQIEDLIQKRNELIEEVGNLTQMKDKSFQEFEQLSLKNAQLAELNNQLVHQIQGLYKANAAPSLDAVRPPNGLGIYTHHQKETSQVSVDGREMRPTGSDGSHPGSQSNIHQENEADQATILTAPHLVNIRKGQPKKFNWKKGGQNVAKGVTKGIKGAFSSNDQPKYQREGSFAEGVPYGSLPSGSDYHTGSLPRSTINDPSRQGFGFFGNQKGKPGQFKTTPNGSSAMIVGEGGTGKILCDQSQPNEINEV
ncbi:MAG: Rho-type gtpase-activating protein [Pleopsidium flavum]|nr:MAG: Rho-type gtpase-activating protein [Pleopsidium flavum]